MHLWTDYESKTLGGYLLGRLNRSEGRNAFFSTATPDGQPALLRLTEAHFDESELIGRWRRIAAVSHPHLQAIKRAGQTTFDGLSLACCLLEPTDASLSDALREGVLSVEETKDIAEAVGGALAALHAAGLIHEHVDATNVFASGEVIKLRSDCCRECVGEFEADTPEAREALRQRDVHDFGVLLLRCLGLDWMGHTSTRLPKPFDRIIPGAFNGTLKAEDIVAILQPPPKQTPVVPAVQQASTGATIPRPAASIPKAAASEENNTEPTGSHRVASSPLQDEPTLAHSRLAATEEIAADANVLPATGIAGMGNRLRMGLDDLLEQSRQHLGTTSIGAGLMRRFRPMKPRPISRKTYIASGAAAAMLGIVIWAAAGGKHEDNKQEATPQHAAIVDGKPATQQNTVKQQPVSQRPASRPAAVPEAQPAQNSLIASGERAGWHVIAYTYKYEQQAQAQVMKLQHKYVSLHPQVFTPTGHAPYFVALGNPSDETTAMDLRNRARQVGLPRDTYARNF
ncbi:hypothetical protein [Terriglobus albidus]|uniref:hypothetical protein n=1 Tax=Terriglobus albidus TaxID=1592106 RepID=UPI0021E053B6|nr:hypothetical protein [Terriglobus albidus]